MVMSQCLIARVAVSQAPHAVISSAVNYINVGLMCQSLLLTYTMEDNFD